MKLATGRPPKNILRKDVVLKNLVVNFGQMECKQVLEQKVAIYIDYEAPLKETDVSPGHNGTFTIVQIRSENPIHFKDDKGIALIKLYKKTDLTEFLPDDILEMLDIYVEEQMNSGEKFTVLDYKRSTSNKVNKEWRAKYGLL